jgi:nitrite reductase/ring-hydroxylating ferredoxin subunit
VSETNQPGADDGADRRSFLGSVSGLALAGGLAASYGTFAWISGRYLYPANPRRMGWMYVTRVADVPVGGSVEYTAPSGDRVAIARQGEGSEAGDFIALSSTCPHLGCSVHWEAQNNRFFCPCHNGVFDPKGLGVGGPPADVSPPQSLPEFDLRVEAGLLYIEVPLEKLASADDASEDAPVRVARGVDPCLEPDPTGRDDGGRF